MDDETCEGCTMFEKNEWCYIVKHGREKNCPCRACLIKVMCYASCDEYNEYVENRNKP